MCCAPEFKPQLRQIGRSRSQSQSQPLCITSLNPFMQCRSGTQTWRADPDTWPGFYNLQDLNLRPWLLLESGKCFSCCLSWRVANIKAVLSLEAYKDFNNLLVSSFYAIQDILNSAPWVISRYGEQCDKLIISFKFFSPSSKIEMLSFRDNTIVASYDTGL